MFLFFCEIYSVLLSCIKLVENLFAQGIVFAETGHTSLISIVYDNDIHVLPKTSAKRIVFSLERIKNIVEIAKRSQ